MYHFIQFFLLVQICRLISFSFLFLFLIMVLYFHLIIKQNPRHFYYIKLKNLLYFDILKPTSHFKEDQFIIMINLIHLILFIIKYVNFLLQLCFAQSNLQLFSLKYLIIIISFSSIFILSYLIIIIIRFCSIHLD